MPSPALSPPISSPAAPRTLRWIVLLAASGLLHWFVLMLATDEPGSMAPRTAPPPQVMRATLSVAPAPVPEAVVVAVDAPAPTKRALPRPAPVKRAVKPRPAPPVAAVVTPPAANDSASVTSVPVQDATLFEPAPPEPAVAAAGVTPATSTAADISLDAETKGASATKQAGTAQAGDAPGQDRAPRYTVSLPPPATLDYEVRYATRGNITRGSSKIDWQPGDGGYAIRGEVTKFGFALSSFRSEGAIDDAGIAPTLYAEKNARRSETNTHFQRKATPMISFSAATATFPLLTGAQDRASILWQLSGIARGDRQAFVPGAVLDVFVAGVRDAEHWLIRIVGEESVTLETGEARAWHLVRTPRSGTYDKRIDIWLAPDQQWYPVKLRYTEVNGDYLDLSLSAVRAAGAR